MTEETYSPRKLALELGFTQEQADHYERRGTNATNLRKIAKAMDLPGTKQSIASPPDAQGEGKKHKHSYRKDGTCACGAVRKVKWL